MVGMRFRRGRLVGVLMAGLAAAACSSEGSGPVDPPATVQAQYVLISANGQSMPVSIPVLGEIGATFTILADTIRLLGGDLWERRFVHITERSSEGGNSTGATVFVDGFVRMDGPVSVLDFVCGDILLCADPERVTISGNELRIDRSTMTGLEDLLYQRR